MHLPIACITKSLLANEKRELQDGEDEIAKKINQQIETSLDEQKSRTWQVKAYELTVNLGRMLDVEAVLTLDAEADTKFCFTLYHGYQVKSVTSLTKDVSVSFTQGKDLLVVQTDRPTNQLKILISYSGYANRFYANSQAAMLPGWFAWYPMAGDQAILRLIKTGEMVEELVTIHMQGRITLIFAFKPIKSCDEFEKSVIDRKADKI